MDDTKKARSKRAKRLVHRRQPPSPVPGCRQWHCREGPVPSPTVTTIMMGAAAVLVRRRRDPAGQGPLPAAAARRPGVTIWTAEMDVSPPASASEAGPGWISGPGIGH